MFKFKVDKQIRLMKKACLVLLLSGGMVQANQATTIQTLLETFGSGCSTTKGPYTRRLNDVAMNLSHVLESVVNSDECKGFASVASNVRGSLMRLANEAPAYSGAEIEYEGLNAKKNILVASIAVEKDPAVLSSLKLDLKTIEVGIAQLKSEIDLDNYNIRSYRLLEAAQSYQAATDALFSSLAQSEQCLLKHPSVMQSVGAVGMALAQSSTLAISTGGTSVLAGAGIFTISRITSYMKEKKNQKYLKALTDAMLPGALSCAMESLNEIYCESDGVEKLGTFVLSPQFRLNRVIDHEAFEGLELLEKALPVLDNTLALIKVGSDPSSGVDGIRRSSINTLKTVLQGTKGTFEGYFRDLKRNISAMDRNKSPDDLRKAIFSEQKAIIDRFLNSVGIFNSLMAAQINTGGDGPPLMFDNFKGDQARYYLMGFNIDNMNFEGAVPTIRFNDLAIEGSYRSDQPELDPWKRHALATGETHFIEDIDQFYVQVQRRFQRWFNLAQDRLDNQSKLILMTDKKEIIASLDEPIARDNKMTPLRYLESLANFVASSRTQKYLRPRQQRIAEEVATILDNVVYKISEIPFNLPEERFRKEADRVFAEILSETYYAEDSRYLITRLTSLINAIVYQASIELYKNGNKDVIYALASADIVKELKSYAGKQKSTVDMINDARKAKGQIIPVFAAFVDAFKDVIETNLVQLNKPENRNRRALDRGHLCLQLLGLDQNFKTGFFSKDFISKVLIPNCEGATMPPIAGTPSAPIVTRKLWEAPTEERICLHQNWRRKLSLFEKNIN